MVPVDPWPAARGTRRAAAAACSVLPLLLVALCGAMARAADLDDALAKLRAGRLTEAEAMLSQVLEAQPDQLSALYWRGRCRSAGEDWEAAAADFRAVLARKPESLPSRVGLALAYEQLGRTAEAADEYRHVLQAQPGNSEAAEGLARLEHQPTARPGPALASRAAAAALELPEPLPVRPASAGLGPRVAVEVDGLEGSFAGLLASSGLDAAGPQLLDYTFGSAPTDWVPTAGVWAVSSRFACDPSWSFFGGHSRGLAIVWNKRQFLGDIVVEAYVSFKHGLPFNSRAWSYRPADLCLTLCGDGENPGSGYSFIYAGDEGSATMIKKGDRTLASTSDPEFLSPSYSDVRPATEDFHRRWWRLEAHREGGRLSFFVDGKQALSVADPEPLPGGRIALWTVRNGMMVARVRVAYEQELRVQEPAVRVEQPLPLPERATALAAVP